MHAKIRVDRSPFPQSHAERLDHTAVDLAFHREPIERQPTILHLDHFDGPHFTRFHINLDFREADTMNAATLKFRAPHTVRGDARGGQRSTSLFPSNRFSATANIAARKSDFFRLCIAEERRDLFGNRKTSLHGSIFHRWGQRCGRG